MKAVVIEEFGGEEKLQVKEVPTPEPKENEVQIHVAYAGVNPIDWKIREGYTKDWFPYEFPIVLGWDAAGTVSRVGSGVSHLKEGERVFTYCRKPVIQWGAYAEYVCFDAEHVVKLPENLSLQQAASIPLAALTAWQCLFDFVDLKKGQTILIHAGAGGVGGFAIQFAHHRGAHVITTASAANHAYVKELGADRVIDYTKENFVDVIKKEHPDGIDAVFDCVGGQVLEDSFAVIKEGGALVTIVNKNIDQLSAPNGIRTGFVLVCPQGKDLASIAQLIAQGDVVAPRIEEFSIEQVAEAHLKSQSAHTCGKIVLKMP